MEVRVARCFSPETSDVNENEFIMDVKKGPWTAEEDALLMNYVSINGEGRWNSVARFAGLKRTGKSCRLRWLNYLRPDLRRGSITLQEQLLILELHSRWGNRWSKISQYLPGRTDNEIKNYWRTRVQKQAKQLKCEVNSKQFRDAMEHVWMPRLRERIQSLSGNSASSAQPTDAATYPVDPTSNHTRDQNIVYQMDQTAGWSNTFNSSFITEILAASSDSYLDNTQASLVSYSSDHYGPWEGSCMDKSFITEIPAASSDSYVDNTQVSLVSDSSDHYCPWEGSCMDNIFDVSFSWPENLCDSPGDLMMENMWNEENIRLLQQQLFED
ncbi:transcription factor MYB78-like [Punica granatum]|uniref:Uncharacterized protein n=2 Tax=Punica granatum TaxID=22663 RepID=A0A218VR63_PUNGR|nr:transcription factor MYB78-like [Punica granatum]OWM62836.1 hypothetical protein CDL15_Pgr020130 [Punica granatum]PKI65504.1 hypothetical protein CRG98_014114 [Punica granatum]